MGNAQYGTVYNSTELLAEAQKMYEVYHIHISETYSGKRQVVQDGWKQMMGDHCIVVHSSDEVSSVIATIVSKNGASEQTEEVAAKPEDEPKDKPKDEEML
jgi:hypothetical protein